MKKKTALQHELNYYISEKTEPPCDTLGTQQPSDIGFTRKNVNNRYEVNYYIVHEMPKSGEIRQVSEMSYRN